jgi:ABC-type uncharacterized transport system permease subunit
MLAQTFHSFSNSAIGLPASVALHAAMLGYLIAAVIGIAALYAPAKVRMVWADWTGGVATLALVVYFGARVVESGVAPLQNMFEVVTASALCLALAYFVSTRLKPMPALGGFAYPALVGIFLVNLMLAGSLTGASAGEVANPLIAVHVLLVVLAYGVFFMAAVAAWMFLIQERALKQRRNEGLVKHLPSLESLRRLLHRTVLVGLPLLTVGFVLGFAAFPPSQWGALLATPKVLTSLVLWAVLLAAVVGRFTGWLHGRRHSYLVLLGFALVLLTYVGLGLFVREGGSPRQAAHARTVVCSGL